MILAESFSTPLAVRFAAEGPRGLQALVLCAEFVSPPRRDLLSRVALMLLPVLFAFGLPESVCRHFLVGEAAPKSLVDAVRSTVSSVSSGVLAQRLRSVLSCHESRELQNISVPLLYISGVGDRLISGRSFQEIRQAMPGIKFASIEAPHFILQANPQEAVEAVVTFLRQVRTESGQGIALE